MQTQNRLRARLTTMLLDAYEAAQVRVALWYSNITGDNAPYVRLGLREERHLRNLPQTPGAPTPMVNGEPVIPSEPSTLDDFRARLERMIEDAEAEARRTAHQSTAAPEWDLSDEAWQANAEHLRRREQLQEAQASADAQERDEPEGWSQGKGRRW